MTEHREGGGTFHNLKGFMEGGEKLEQLQDSLLHKVRQNELLEDINEFVKKQAETTEKVGS